jgi:uncharacterized protein (DUF2147 family)
MNRVSCIVFSLCVCAPGFISVSWAEAGEPAVAAAKGDEADALKGKWKHPEQDVVVEIVKTGAGYEGKIAESNVPAVAVGKLLIRGVSYDAQKHEWHGEVFAVKRGQFVPMTATLNANSLHMTAGSGLLAKKLNWTKVD